jgi:hypothetical protein
MLAAAPEIAQRAAVSMLILHKIKDRRLMARFVL